jgi:hypothetical protein
MAGGARALGREYHSIRTWPPVVKMLAIRAEVLVLPRITGWDIAAL